MHLTYDAIQQLSCVNLRRRCDRVIGPETHFKLDVHLTELHYINWDHTRLLKLVLDDVLNTTTNPNPALFLTMFCSQ